MKELVYFCQGESHKATNKVCQDYALCRIFDNMSVAILSDGHGGNRYFRSDIGAKLAVECTLENVKEFVNNVRDSVFEGKPFTAIDALTAERKKSDFRKNSIADQQLHQLFASIIFSWRTAINRYTEEHPFSEEESKVLKGTKDLDEIEKTYGCTLMCYVITTHYWFAFHIGDGKCVIFENTGSWKEPIPWDEQCFLNKTTSLCDRDSISEFRYCYQGDGNFPVAAFLASDGLDDSFGEISNQANFYIQILKCIDKSSNEETQKEIEESLPTLSKIGSKDDMSIACLYEEQNIHKVIPLYIKWQQTYIKSQIDSINNRIKVLRNKQANHCSSASCEVKDKIEEDYTNKELERLFIAKKELANKYDNFSKEIDGEVLCPYSDEIGMEYIS